MVRVPLVIRRSFSGGTRAALLYMRYIVVLSNKVGLLQQFTYGLLKYANNTFISFRTKFSAISKLLLSILLPVVIVINTMLLCELNGVCDETITCVMWSVQLQNCVYSDVGFPTCGG